MKNTFAVSDSSIFMDLYDINVLSFFFELELDIYTLSSIVSELGYEQRQILNRYKKENKITIHNLKELDFIEINTHNYPKSLSETDKSILYIANRLNSNILSSCKFFRGYAKNKTIEIHGTLWILDKLIENFLFSKKEASEKLRKLIYNNLFYQSNKQLMKDIDFRIKCWQ